MIILSMYVFFSSENEINEMNEMNEMNLMNEMK